jgi:hypothetical protein
LLIFQTTIWGGNIMASIRDLAKGYEAKTTKNICELSSVSTEFETEEREFTNNEGKAFSVNVALINGEEYRVPDSVIAQLQSILVETPAIVKFKVKKTGEGMATKYQVIPLG